ncbi:MAG: metallophosphoesterase family protein [Spirochaetales bacterium]|nr:metallophosphoesterase family protein [Spirochaetales bacterium]
MIRRPTEHRFRLISTDLNSLFCKAPGHKIGPEDRIVIFSDLHLGNGSSRDDFLSNGDIFPQVLSQYYLKQNYFLILNGDVEELQKFSLHDILEKWQTLFDIFTAFQSRNSIIKIIGNHDYDLLLAPEQPVPHIPAYRLHYGEEDLFILHGHQASPTYSRYNTLFGYFLRYIATPLGFRNISVSHDSERKKYYESMLYDYSSSRGIISIMGHTHRPLFESLSKMDTLKYQLENLLREYPTAKAGRREEIAKEVLGIRHDLISYRKKGQNANQGNIYSRDVVIPCLFNSGCAIGRRGFTGIEITGNMISLVHWFDSDYASRHMSEYKNFQPLKGTPYLKRVIKEDNLDYIFARIKLLKKPDP